MTSNVINHAKHPEMVSFFASLETWVKKSRKLWARPNVVAVSKPRGISLPNRVWKRNSALYMSMHELGQDRQS